MAAGRRKKKRDAGSALKSVIVFAIMAGLVVLAYYRVANREKAVQAETNVEITAVQKVLMKDLETDYPPSPKEVVKYYSELTKCLYNEDCTDEDIEALAEKSFLIYDDELAENQQWERYIADLKSEIATKKSQDYAIMSYTVSSSVDVNYFTKDQYECASLYCTYSIRNGAKAGSVRELFILRRDEDGHWRILGWDLPKDDAAEGIEG